MQAFKVKRIDREEAPPGPWRGGGYKIERYWAEDLSEDEWQAIFAEVFGPEAVQ